MSKGATVTVIYYTFTERDYYEKVAQGMVQKKLRKATVRYKVF
jgi:hypothetical protein